MTLVGQDDRAEYVSLCRPTMGSAAAAAVGRTNQLLILSFRALTNGLPRRIALIQKPTSPVMISPVATLVATVAENRKGVRAARGKTAALNPEESQAGVELPTFFK
jgi:hypothetical protein